MYSRANCRSFSNVSRESIEDARGLVGRHVAQHALREVQVLVRAASARRRGARSVRIAPQLAQVVDVGRSSRSVAVFGHGADDEAAASPSGGSSCCSLLAQLLALRLVLDPLRDADVRVLRQVDQQPPGDD